jgi:uncharacterized protein (DUF1810 family)
MTDTFDLQRFLDAQLPVYPRVLDELRCGRKQSHWMWFISPQLAGLGHSAMARHFAISSRREAIAYLMHDVLGARLKECTALINAVEPRCCFGATPLVAELPRSNGQTTAWPSAPSRAKGEEKG